MRKAVPETKVPMTVEECVQFELRSEKRHEYVNGQLFEMPKEKDINNEIAFEIGVLLRPLKERGFSIHLEV